MHTHTLIPPLSTMTVDSRALPTLRGEHWSHTRINASWYPLARLGAGKGAFVNPRYANALDPRQWSAVAVDPQTDSIDLVDQLGGTPINSGSQHRLIDTLPRGGRA